MKKQKSVENRWTESEKGNFQWGRLTEENTQTELVSRVFKYWEWKKKKKEGRENKSLLTNREGHKNQWAIDNGFYMALFFKEKNEEKKFGKLVNNDSLVKVVIDEM